MSASRYPADVSLFFSYDHLAPDSGLWECNFDIWEREEARLTVVANCQKIHNSTNTAWNSLKCTQKNGLFRTWEAGSLVSLDHPAARKNTPLSDKQGEESAMGRRLTVGDIDDEDLLAPARGAVNGVLLSLIIWVPIAVTWLVL
jgi:hypothetical protein